MLSLQDLVHYLDELFPSQGIVDYCPNGLQIEGKPLIKKIATAVSASLKTIEHAARIEADCLIVHHGMFWQKDSYEILGIKKEKIKCLLDNGISLFAYHLPMDLHPDLGNNWHAARQMGWQNLKPFGAVNQMKIGVKGEFPICSVEAFTMQLELYYRHQATCALGGRKEIRSAALISGGAHRNLVNALKENVDAFITGSFDEPTWHQAFEERINFFALGHAATERVGPIALNQHLNDHLEIPCEFIDIPNPF